VHNSTGWMLFLALVQVLLNYGVFIASSAHVPASLQLYYSSTSTTRDHALPCFLSYLSAGQTCSLNTPDVLFADVLFAQISFAHILSLRDN